MNVLRCLPEIFRLSIFQPWTAHFNHSDLLAGLVNGRGIIIIIIMIIIIIIITSNNNNNNNNNNNILLLLLLLSLLHVVGGCQQYLDRFTWRHDSILNFIARSLQPVINVHSSLYANVNGFLNPSIITAENYRPERLFLIQSKWLYVVELTVGFESKLNNNAVRKREKYLNLIREMSRNYRCVKFVNLSMSSLGVFSDECSTFLDMMNDIGIDKKQQRYIIKKMINIAIRATYYIFCCRNRNWDSPDLMQF